MDIDNIINERKNNTPIKVDDTLNKKAISNQVAHHAHICFDTGECRDVVIIGKFNSVNKNIENWLGGKKPLKCCTSFSYTETGVYIADQTTLPITEYGVSINLDLNRDSVYILGYMQSNYRFNYSLKH